MKPSKMNHVIERILVPHEDIMRRIDEMAAQIERDYAGQELVCVGILKGSVYFFSQLTMRIDMPLALDFMAISSYGAATKSSGVVQMIKDISIPVDGKHVLIIEDIVDSGLTLNYLLENMLARQAASVKVCTLLDKPSRRKVALQPDYCGFEIENHFVVGFGLDYAEKYRNLPDIGILKPEVYGEKA